MKLFDKILCPIDFSEDSVKALQWTEYLAKAHGSEVTILHVMEPYPASLDIGIDYDRYHSAVVRDMEGFLSPLTIPYQSMQSSGLPSEKITTLAKTIGASLILMSTRGLRGAAHKLIGSTAESVIRSASVPVLTLSPECHHPSAMDAEKILIPISSLTWPTPGYIRLKKILRDLQRSITMMHVVEMNDKMFNASFDANPVLVTTYQVAERKRSLEQIGFRLDKEQTYIDTVLEFGDVSEEILKEAGSGHYGWLLMGAKHHKLFSRFFGSHAYNVISRSNIPVITIAMG